MIGETSTHAVEVNDLTYRFGKRVVLDLSFQVPQGAIYALIGPNGAGKTTLLHILAGLRRQAGGAVHVGGRAPSVAVTEWRQRCTYVAEGQQLPRWMRLEQLESFLRPLYPAWDDDLASRLRDRFALRPRDVIGAMSRGQYMKAALLCALAPRPQLLLMDEPFTGMDVTVRDELSRGLLDSAATDGCTVVISSHDIAELELLADWVGFIQEGRMLFSESLDMLRRRFVRVDVTLSPAAGADVAPSATRLPQLPPTWLALEQAGRHVRFVADNNVARADDAIMPNLATAAPGGSGAGVTTDAATDALDASIRQLLPAEAVRMEPVPLRDLFISLVAPRERQLENVS